MKWYLLALKNYAQFKGRARRKEYWYFTLFSTLISILFSLTDTYAHTLYLDTLYTLAILVPSIAVGVRRMHDVNKSGWYILIPFYNLVLACTPGTEGPNEYGDDPKTNALEHEVELIGRN